jgi:lipopolysaccharide transport protein LptA
MAASLPDIARAIAAAALICCFAAAAAPTEKLQQLPRLSKDQPIELVAASSDVDYKNNTLVFRQVTVTQGPLKVEAQQATATGLDFENSEWNLTGQVRITTADGKLASDDAKLTFRNNAIARAIVHGAPAEFEQKLEDSQQLAKGHANTIDYDLEAGTVNLQGSAWLTDGDNVIRGDTLIYDVAKQRVAANPGATAPGGVHITINPKSQDKPGTKTPDKPEAPKQDKPK